MKLDSNPSEAEEDVAARSPADDVLVALKSALALGASLLFTWSVGIFVRLFLPRYLGPELFGTYNFADSFCMTFFVFLGLGVETYIQKEIPVRPEHASDFFGGLIVLRLGLSALLFAAMMVVMTLTHRAPAVQRVVFTFGAAQMLLTLNGNLAALLHASRNVSELAVINVASKLLWGAGIGLSLKYHAGLAALAAALVLSESLRALALLALTRRYLGLRMEWNPAAVWAVILASFPFYLSQVTNNVYGKIGVSLLSILANDTEVGWYSSALSVAALSLLVAPLVGSVLFPLLARAAGRSQEQMFAIMSRAVRWILLLVLPVSLLLGLGADVWIHALFGDSFAPAARSLQIMAPMFVFIYVAMIVGTCLVLLGRSWMVTAVSFAALALNLALNAALVPRGLGWFGPGGASAAAATAVTLTELAVTAALVFALGARAFERSSVVSGARAVAGSLLVIALDALLRPLGPARLAIDTTAYFLLLFALGALRVEDTKRAAQLLLRRHRHHAAS